MFDLLGQSGMIQTMDKAMTLATRRLGLIASNLANVDTPGYRTQDFSFQDALRAEMGPQGGGNFGLTRTHAAHLTAGGTSSGPRPSEVRSGWERNDGNDVNLDRENLLLARTQGQYSLASTFAQVEIRKVYQAIREGAK